MRHSGRALILCLGLLACAGSSTGDPIVPPPPPPPPPPQPPPPPGPGIGPIITLTPSSFVFDEDTELRTTLTHRNCTGAAWSLEGTSNPDYVPVLEGDVLVHRFAPDRTGGGAVTLRLACDEGDVAIPINVVVRPQPDITVTLHEVTGADQLLAAPIRVAVNGVETTLAPGGGRVQFQQGANQLQLVTNPGWRSLQVWELNGLTIPLNEAGPGFQVTVNGTGDEGTAVVRLLHATAHAWYRAGSESEADVRALYWSDGSGGIGTGFVGINSTQYVATGRPIFTQLGPLVVDGVEVCSAVSPDWYYLYQAAVEAWRTPYAGMSASMGWSLVENVEDLTPYASIVGGELQIANGWSLACDAQVPVVDEFYRPSPTGQIEHLVIRIPAGSSQADRIAALWRLPRKMGRKVPGSAWVSATTVPGPADLKVAEHIFPLADAGAIRGMPPVRF